MSARDWLAGGLRVADRVRVEEEDTDSVRLTVSAGSRPLAVGDNVGATVREPCADAEGSLDRDCSEVALPWLLGVA